MQNVVPTRTPVERAVAERALADRLDAYADEARRLIDAALAVMRATGTLEPRVSDIVAAARLNNQAFYRHFRGKDDLLLAVLADGEQRLVESLTRRVARAATPREQVAAWIDGVMAQARDPEAAAATRPFAVHGTRLAERFPAETAASRASLFDTLRPAIADAGGDAQRDTELVAELALARMRQAIVERHAPTRAEVEHLVRFCLGGLSRGDG